jgi:hypothetical protein
MIVSPKQRAAQASLTRAMIKMERPFAREITIIINRYIKAALANDDFARNEMAHYSRLQLEIEQVFEKRMKRSISFFSRNKLQGKKGAENFLEKKVDIFFTDLLAQRFIQNIGGNNIKQISKTTRKQVRDALSLSIESELVSGDIEAISAEKRLRQLAMFTPSRAMTIAATEIHASAMFAGHETLNELQNEEGFEYYKAWVPAIDERTRAWHADMDSNQFIPLNQPFIVDGQEMMYPGDSNGGAANVINCRCVTFEERKEFL